MRQDERVRMNGGKTEEERVQWGLGESVIYVYVYTV
jgi:hypothetical protein